MNDYAVNQALKTLEEYLRHMNEEHLLSFVNEMRQELAIYDEKERTLWLTVRIGLGVVTIDDQLEHDYESFADNLVIEVNDTYMNTEAYGVQSVEVVDMLVQSVELENS